MSNATNSSSLSLSISGKILSLINLSSKSLLLKPDTNQLIEKSITISTEKRNFQILEMIFEKSKSTTPAWQAESPLDIKYNVTRSDTADADGYYDYVLNFSFKHAPEKTISGYFFLNTNHPKEESIKIRGIIKPIEKQDKKR